jgi:lipid-A-disaccharide synthase
MRYYVIAGEASGDLHASLIIRELKKLDDKAVFRAWGGDKMQAQGAEVVKHYRELAFMGFLEVALNLRTILKNLRDCKDDITGFKPDVLICVDYPGFNMRIAKFAHKQGINVIYYIAPQVWAWWRSRVHKIHRIVDKAFVVLPFEKDFHAGFGYSVEFTGHPLIDTIDESDASAAPLFRKNNNLDDKPIIALVPGSRKQEISRLGPVMIKAAANFPGYTFIAAGVSTIPEEYYKKYIGTKNIRIIYKQTYDLLRNSSAALVTSGTATLETALLGVPQVVCYKMSLTSALVAWMVVKVKYISLVNLILDKEAVKELIQYQCTSKTISDELNRILNNMQYREKELDDYRELRVKTGEHGASGRAAEIIWKTINKELPTTK